MMAAGLMMWVGLLCCACSNLLLQRIERKDTRVFAHAAAETQSAIAQSSRPVTRAGASLPTPVGRVHPKLHSRSSEHLSSTTDNTCHCTAGRASFGLLAPDTCIFTVPATANYHAQPFRALCVGISCRSSRTHTHERRQSPAGLP